MKKYISFIRRINVLVTIIIFVVSMPAINAMSAKQRQVFNSGALFFNVECSLNPNGPESSVMDLSTLPVREKLAQMLMPRVENADDIETVTQAGVGGYLVPRSKIQELSSSVKGNLDAQKPFLVSVDGEGGTVGVPIETDPPSAQEMGDKSVEEVQQIAKNFGADLAELGVTMDLAPVLDIVDNPSASFLGTRSFGGTSDKVVRKAGAFANGLKESKILPTFKHFPGHGNAHVRGGTALANTHEEDGVVESKDRLLTSNLVPFAELASSAPSAVMMGHLFIPDINPDTPATLSPEVINGLLRQELGYQGLVITDDMGDMAPITSRFPGDFTGAVLQAILAGNDIVLFNGNIGQLGAVLDRLEQAVTDGALSDERINESMARIKTAKDFVAIQAATTSGCDCSANSGTGDFSGSNNVEIAYNFFTSKSLGPEQASGIIGNLMLESSPELNPTAVNNTPVAGYPGHYGIAQWGSRQAYLEAFAAALGVEKGDFQMQLKFIWHELTGESEAPSAPNAGAYRGSTYDPLINMTQTGTAGVEEATYIFENNYEVSGEAGMDQRIEYAQQVFGLYGGGRGTGINCGGESTGDFIWPVDPPGTLTACWGDNRGSHLHSGIDIGVPEGSRILAADGGTIEVSEDQGGGYGKVIVIKHSNGKWTLYGHNSELLKNVGDTVSQGDEIARSGNTGSSSGPHLHFNVQEIGGVQGNGTNTENPLTTGLNVPAEVGSRTLCDEFPDGGRDTGFRS